MPKAQGSIDVANPKILRKVLSEGEELFRSVVENSFTGIILADSEFKIIYCNAEAAQIRARSKKDLIRRDFRKFLHKESIELVQERFLRRQNGEKPPSRYEIKIVRKDCETRTIEIKCSIVKPKNGGIYTLAQLIDITERKKMEEQRNRFTESLSALNAYGQSLNMAKSMEHIYKLTLDATEKTLGFEIASILMAQGKKLRLAAQRGYARPFSLELPMEAKRGITVRATSKGKSIYVPDVRKDAAYVDSESVLKFKSKKNERPKETRRAKILSELAVPIKIGSHVLGVLNVESIKLAGFDEDHRKLLEILSSHAATAISNLQRKKQLKEISQKLSCLMKNATEIMHAKEMRRKLKVIAKAIIKFGWRRAVISLRDENLEGTDLVTAGLTREEVRLLLKRKASGKVWKERLGPKFEKFKIGEFYYLPWTNAWIRKNVHGVSPEAPLDEATTYAGVPSRLSVQEMVDWHPQDMIYAPLGAPSGRIVGILSMDDPTDGKTPTRETLAPLELFLHQAAIIIENAQLIESLREAREKLEQTVQERTQELRKSQENLLKAQRLAVIGELAGMVGHDLRNPLTSIAGATYFLKRRSNLLDKKTTEMLELIGKNIEHSNKIINDLLEYSREVKLEPTKTTPKTIIRETLDFVKKRRNIKIIDQTENEPEISVDHEKLKRAFINLIRNALDAMPKRGRLTIKSRKKDNTVEFEFSDTGVGMKKETLERLWTPLFTTKAKGMGFGLPICKRIIEAHRGSVSVTSRFGKGTTFTVSLPIQQKIEEGGEQIWMKLPESLLSMTMKT